MYVAVDWDVKQQQKKNILSRLRNYSTIGNTYTINLPTEIHKTTILFFYRVELVPVHQDRVVKASPQLRSCRRTVT